MGDLEKEIHKQGIMILRAKGELDQDDLEKWREELEEFIKENDERGACGVLVDVCELDGLSTDAIDTLMELLSEPDDFINTIRMRFALIGIKPFTKRFLREAMPLEPIKHVRARFFHEVAEEEALAWLQAMVDSAEELPEGKEEDKAADKTPDQPEAKKSKAKDEKTEDDAQEKKSLRARLRREKTAEESKGEDKEKDKDKEKAKK
jgi:hypothetical protein